MPYKIKKYIIERRKHVINRILHKRKDLSIDQEVENIARELKRCKRQIYRDWATRNTLNDAT